MKRGVFLDRDNTILANDGDLGDPNLVRLLPGASWGIRALRESGYTIVVVTNQGGVARGRYGVRDVDAVHARTAELLERESEWTSREPLVTKWIFCPFHPDGTVAEFRIEHPWRKPAPGMLIDAASEFEIELKNSWMIGDQERDIEAGRAAGCRTIRIQADPSGSPGDGLVRAESGADFIETDLLHASHRILRIDGLDGAPVWTSTSAARIVAAPGQLADEQTRETIATVAHALAEREGVRVARIAVDATGIELEVVGCEIVAVGFAAELRRTTNDWARSRGIGPLWMNG